MPRFVLLHHDHPSPHYDLMLEAGDALWTWRLARPPGAVPQPAERIADHRQMYLDYDGPVSGGRGEVRRESAGTFEWVEREEGRVVVRLEGGGALTLQSVAGGWAVHLAPGRPSTDSP
ncbi:MAG: DNA polymerase ligase N-terminal domain-containing protein [Gemmataceae bacterium]